MWYYHPFFYGGFDWFGIIIWVLIIAGIIILLKSTRNDRWQRHGDKKPLDILKERYAKGEITAEQFEKMKKDIS